MSVAAPAAVVSVACPACRSQVGAPCLRYDGTVIERGHEARRITAAGFEPDRFKRPVGFDLSASMGPKPKAKRAPSPFPKTRPKPVAGWDAPPA